MENDSSLGQVISLGLDLIVSKSSIETTPQPTPQPGEDYFYNAATGESQYDTGNSFGGRGVEWGGASLMAGGGVGRGSFDTSNSYSYENIVTQMQLECKPLTHLSTRGLK